MCYQAGTRINMNGVEMDVNKLGIPLVNNTAPSEPTGFQTPTPGNIYVDASLETFLAALKARMGWSGHVSKEFVES